MNAKLIFLLIVLLLACATQVSSDVYLPSLLTIAHTLEGGSLRLAQLSITLFLFAVSLSQLIMGPISEGIGRKWPLVIGLVIMAIGSVICATATHINGLLLGRFIQGIGAGALAALWRAIFRDVMTGEDLAKYSSVVSVFMIFVVSAAPALGGYFEKAGWRSAFVFMLLYCVVALLVMVFQYKETNAGVHLDKLKPVAIYQHYKSLISHPVFIVMTLCVCLSYGGLFSWIVVSPTLLMKHIGLSATQFGWLMAVICAVGYSAGAVVNARYVKKFGMPLMMRIGWSLMIVGGLLQWGGYYVSGISLSAIVLPVFVFYFGSTLIWPNAFATAFTPFGHIAGYAGSLYGFMQLVGGAIIGSLAAHLPASDQRPLALIIITTALLAFILYQCLVLPAIFRESNDAGA